MRISIFVITLMLIVPINAYAVQPKEGKPYDVPRSVPATIDEVRYITGYPPIDMDKYFRNSRPRCRFELRTSDAAFSRTRMKQDGSKTLEDLDMIQFRYSDIQALYFGREAIEKAVAGSLPTAAKSVMPLSGGLFSSDVYLVPLDEVMRGRNHSPVVIIYKEGGDVISLVFIAPHGAAKALYEVLAREAKLKVKSPAQY